MKVLKNSLHEGQHNGIVNNVLQRFQMLPAETR